MGVKKRTLNELRQEKEFGYKQPLTKNNKINGQVTPYDKIINLVKESPNDSDLGRKIRNLVSNTRSKI